jgi:hypothetical protein
MKKRNIAVNLRFDRKLEPAKKSARESSADFPGH